MFVRSQTADDGTTTGPVAMASLRVAVLHTCDYRSAMRFILLSVMTALLSAGCDRMITPRHAQQLKDAESKAAAGDFARAISLYESALEDRPGDAEVHYKLALLYDDKMNDPLNALHHFKRYLIIAPNGARANDVKGFVKRDEVALLTSLSGDALISRAEATRLRNENLSLRKELDEARGRAHIAAIEQSQRYGRVHGLRDRKSTRLNSSHRCISYAVFCLKKKNNNNQRSVTRRLPPTRV